MLTNLCYEVQKHRIPDELWLVYKNSRDWRRQFIRRRLNVSYALEIIILMVWSIWTTRNDWVFNNIHPTVQDCKRRFCNEFNLLLHRVKPPKLDEMKVWFALHQ
ncbi:hypothetical protein PVAP13_6NG056066 [Panicum virgatum]|uniref:Uncharacterized protein n=1 Tax=Panicum virgatum TaxID=38727 RepID=A0A8T0QUG7_PANVG|nr:hypothetical protein PVAP13_6NG056066 [Panicum virgatum]